MSRIVLVFFALLALSGCASFNNPDDDPALCENGRRPDAHGDCSLR